MTSGEYIGLQADRSRDAEAAEPQIVSRFGGNRAERCLFSDDLFEEPIGDRPESTGLERGLRFREGVEKPGGMAACFSSVCPMDRQMRIGPAQSRSNLLRRHGPAPGRAAAKAAERLTTTDPDTGTIPGSAARSKRDS